MHFTQCLYIICLLGVSLRGWTQEVVQLKNPSFEGIPKESTLPKEWTACAYNSTPDILPGPWDVDLITNFGNTYIGIVTRKDFTTENLAQELSQPFEKGTCYKFTVNLAYSTEYVGYNRPIRLRVWGSDNSCKGKQLFIESPTVKHSDWKSYEFYFIAQENWEYIILEAFYHQPTLIPYKGNILIDNFSIYKPCIKA